MPLALGKKLKIWKCEIKSKGDAKWGYAQVSSSTKDRSGAFKTDFSGYITLFNPAFKKLEEIGIDQSIGIYPTKFEISNYYDRTKDRTYYNFIVYDFELEKPKLQYVATQTDNSEKIDDNDNFMQIPDFGDDDGLPF